MYRLKGDIVNETDRAILFRITSDEHGFHLDGQVEWFPKSKIRLPKKQQGEISIYIPCWLYDDRIRVDETEM